MSNPLRGVGQNLREWTRLRHMLTEVWKYPFRFDYLNKKGKCAFFATINHEKYSRLSQRDIEYAIGVNQSSISRKIKVLSNAVSIDEAAKHKKVLEDQRKWIKIIVLRNTLNSLIIISRRNSKSKHHLIYHCFRIGYTKSSRFHCRFRRHPSGQIWPWRSSPFPISQGIFWGFVKQNILLAL